MHNCVKCDNPLSPDDIGAAKKLINRGLDKDFMCVPCLALKFGVSEERLREKIEYWRNSGCLLFVKE